MYIMRTLHLKLFRMSLKSDDLVSRVESVSTHQGFLPHEVTLCVHESLHEILLVPKE